MKTREQHEPALARGDLESFLRTEFPQAFSAGSGLSIEEVWHGGARVRQAYRQDFIRPGGTISGPTMMALADFAMYVAVLAAIGPVPLAVTTNLNINFLRKPGAADLLAEAKLMKLGKRLAVGEVAIRSVGAGELVAHATSTYSIPDLSEAYAAVL
ncbi:MAG TPA: PaaI family thioesterase [Xanthobacteraceae bacterium]|nr:PaaI family thioesterase [Xanthobacteraceae bacterium]